MDCLPPGLIDRVYYEPATRGYEAEIKERLAAWKSLKRKKGSKFV
jgi:replication-associated recombination protein RarA